MPVTVKPSSLDKKGAQAEKKMQQWVKNYFLILLEDGTETLLAKRKILRAVRKAFES